MKKIISMISIVCMPLVLAPAVLAASALPAGLRCEAETRNEMASRFELRDLNTARPRSNLDAAFEGAIVVGPTVTEFNANNGCDNNYDWVFFSDDLALLAKGKVKRITGLMKFFNADMQCKDADCAETETARVSCSAL